MATSKIKSDSIDTIAAAKIPNLDASKITTGTVSNARITLDAAEIPNLDAGKITTGSLANARVPASAVTQHAADEITKSSSNPTVSTNPSGGVGTVYLNTTSGEMFNCTNATAGSNIWTNVGDGTGGVPVPYPVATGGTITTDGNFKIHTFLTSSNFVVSAIPSSPAVSYLVVAGAGGGGAAGGGGGGGGGAGGFRTATGFTIAATTYAITVGAGGAAGPSGTNNTGTAGSGGNSVFSTITSAGGGGGRNGGAVGNHGVAG